MPAPTSPISGIGKCPSCDQSFPRAQSTALADNNFCSEECERSWNLEQDVSLDA